MRRVQIGAPSARLYSDFTYDIEDVLTRDVFRVLVIGPPALQHLGL